MNDRRSGIDRHSNEDILTNGEALSLDVSLVNTGIIDLIDLPIDSGISDVTIAVSGSSGDLGEIGVDLGKAVTGGTHVIDLGQTALSANQRGVVFFGSIAPLRSVVTVELVTVWETPSM